jgi:hypothetical protein
MAEDQMTDWQPRVVIADCDDDTLVALRAMFTERLPVLRRTGAITAERETRIKLGAVEYVMRERGLIE